MARTGRAGYVVDERLKITLKLRYNCLGVGCHSDAPGDNGLVSTAHYR